MFNLRSFFLLLAVFVAGTIAVSAQITGKGKSNSIERDASERREEPLAPFDNMLETKEKMRRRSEEEAHQKFVARGEEVANLADELKKAFESDGQFNQNGAGKLEQLEKALKKIRKTLGGDDDEESSGETPASINEAVSKLSELGAALRDQLKESTMYTVSADSIGTSNEMLELIAFIRRTWR